MNTENLNKFVPDANAQTSQDKAEHQMRTPHRRQLQHAPYRMLPYQQGHLDPLCGEYALINALRLLTRPHDGLDADFWTELMTFTLVIVDRRFGLRRLRNEGTPRWVFKLLLPTVVGRFNELCGTDVQARTLRELGGGRMPVDPLSELERALKSQRAAAIVLLGGLHDHWTVVRAITAGTVWLFDSDGLRTLQVRDLAMSYKNRAGKKHVLLQSAIRVLSRP